MILDAPCQGQDRTQTVPRRCHGDEGGSFAARLWHKRWSGRLHWDERPLSARSLDVRSWPVSDRRVRRPLLACRNSNLVEKVSQYLTRRSCLPRGSSVLCASRCSS